MSLDDRAHQLADARITDLCLFAGQGGDGVTRDRRVHIPDIVDRFLAPLGEMSTAADRRIIVENVAVDGKSLDVFSRSYCDFCWLMSESSDRRVRNWFDG